MKNISYEVPKKNNEVFLCPALDRIPGLAQENMLMLSAYKSKINGIPFHALRDKTREELLRKAILYTNRMNSMLQEESQVCGHSLNYESIKNLPIIQTGHEPILYHPGVWIKNYLIYLLAKKLGGISVNMIVDNDSCNRGFMYVPVLSNNSASVGRVSLVKNKDHLAYEEVVINDFAAILQFKEEVIDLLRKNAFREEGKIISNNMQEVFGQFVNRMRHYYQQGCCDMVGLLTATRMSLEKEIGIENLEVPVSWMCETEGFFDFMFHIIYNANRFATIYNEKLAEYRSIHKIRSKANPLPDLKVLGNSIEIPFWVWKAVGQRAKCYVINEGDDIKITDGTKVLVALKKGDAVIDNITRLMTLMEAGNKIRPRAITTTMFSRLFFSDVFIHGIGGAKYDAITDEIIKEFFAIEPPVFVTISATLYLPIETYDIDEGALYDSERIINDMRYNPERYAGRDTQIKPAFINNVEEKKRLLKKMAFGNAAEKKHYFNQIKELNKSMLSQIHTELQKKKEETEVIRSKLAFNEVARFREYPLCLYPMKVLCKYSLNVFS